MRTIEINRQINPDSIIVNAFRPYSGTELRRVCIEKGLIPKEQRAEDNRTYEVFYNGVLSSGELEGIRRVFPLYVSMDKSRWEEVRRAETDDDLYGDLKEEYREEILHRKARKESISGLTAEDIFINDEVAIPQ